MAHAPSEKSRISIISTVALRFELILGAIACLGLFYWLQYSTAGICCGDFDGYYHIKWSQMLWEGIKHGQLRLPFNGLPLTTLNPHDYADQHYLFHILLIPFTWLSDLQSGAKLAAMLFGAGAVFSCYWLLWRHRVPFLLLWLLALLAASAPFVYRLSMTRAQSVSIVFMVIGIHLLFCERYRWLMLLAFLYVWTYNLFVLLGLAALLWTIVIWWAQRRIEWRPIVWTSVGILAGLIINPYFPNDVKLLFEHVVVKLWHFSMPVGSEWYAWDSWWLFKSSLVAFAAMAVGYVASGYVAGRNPERREVQPLVFMMLLATSLLILTFRSSRFTEYWPAFSVLFAAFSLKPILHSRKEVIVSEQPQGEGQAMANWLGVATTLLVSLILSIVLLYNLRIAGTMIQLYADYSQDPTQYQRGAEWLRAHVPPGERVFNVTWMVFPKLFFHDPAHGYVSGLDPTYLADQDAQLANAYERIATGKERFPAKAIKERFGAQYVFIGDRLFHSDLKPFYEIATTNAEFDKVYEDRECTILRVR